MSRHHRRPQPLPDVETTHGTEACILGCTTFGEHKPGCPCHDQCPQHDDHCTGCAPTQTHGARSRLCGRCFFNRLRRPLVQIPGMYDWLGIRMHGVRAASYDASTVSGSKEAPLPFNTEMYDLRATMTLLATAWADRGLREAPPGPGLEVVDLRHSCQWLTDHASWVAEQPWVGTLIWHLQELRDRSQALAPWRATRTRLGLPCPKCDRLTLTLYGGEDWVTCDSKDCDEIIGWFRYERLVKSIIGLRKVG